MRSLALACCVLVAVGACGGGTQARVHHEPHPGGDYARHGMATFYNESQMTASGERFDKGALTAAHRTFRMGTMVRVTNEHNGKTVVVRINDRGPFGNKSHIIDLSEAAARRLDMIDAGVVPVTLEVLP